MRQAGLRVVPNRPGPSLGDCRKEVLEAKGCQIVEGMGTRASGAFGGLDRVTKEHGHRGRPHATKARRDPRGDLADRLVDVG